MLQGLKTFCAYWCAAIFFTIILNLLLRIDGNIEFFAGIVVSFIIYCSRRWDKWNFKKIF